MKLLTEKASNSKIDPIKKLEHLKTLYKLRLFRQKFIPLEKIAEKPSFYGYKIQPRESKARQGDFLVDKSKVCALIASNRCGKTEIGIIKFLKICLNYKSSGEAWIITESYDLQKSGVQNKLLSYLKKEQIIHKQYATGTALKELIILNNRGNEITITFKTFEQGAAKLQSAKLICALIDEEPPEDVYNEVYTRTIDLQGQIILTFTPLKGFTWSYERIFCRKAEGISVYNWGMIDNPFIPIEEIELMLRDFTKRQINMRVYGLYQGAERMIFYSFDREKNIRSNLYNPDIEVDICIDWGINITAIGFFQEEKILVNNKVEIVYNLIDAIELSDYGYQQVILYIYAKNYILGQWFCDPAGRGRVQATRSGKSLLFVIKEEFGIDFNYITGLRVEESIELVNSYFCNGYNIARFYIDGSIKLNKEGHDPAMRIENYVRDEKTGQPIKDGINDHFSDILRYYLANKTRKLSNTWEQK